LPKSVAAAPKMSNPAVGSISPPAASSSKLNDHDSDAGEKRQNEQDVEGIVVLYVFHGNLQCPAKSSSSLSFDLRLRGLLQRDNPLGEFCIDPRRRERCGAGHLLRARQRSRPPRNADGCTDNPKLAGDPISNRRLRSKRLRAGPP
jgi:hypothetical protein